MDYLLIINKRNEKGFSLVELSIVLVIMGLLIAGVLGGKEIWQISKLRGVASELQKYKVAIVSFQQTYEGLPGDIKNATSYWAAAADCTQPYTAELNATCNGNNDGRLSANSAGDDTEPYTAWDQLSLAKMIAGTYSGAGTESVVGVNSPKSANFDGAGFSVRYYDAMTAWNYLDSIGRKFSANYMMFGKSSVSRNDVMSSVVNAEDAHYIDSKMDDGTPDFGDVQGGTGELNVGNCTTGVAPNITYNFTNDDISCVLIFNIGTSL